ncbi:hypothetical protein QR77_00615 [Streptomyces sp. 150FB]|uniref:hypothetical protein n=1 Tax=Streptomyces sp. 150FB TaxID=1576605 RepID=UPI0005891398|nr:hypothetical protein [Streptomyces sp. 150FB]KIF72914.1 hypothetical protein QR77_00615 [Streptomyces sp. 150FB]
MSERNRVTPLGDIEAFPLRGAWTGNRGILHRDRKIVRQYASKLWLTCALEYKDSYRELWQPGRATFLYFFDEAVSMAAGHRPCALCRRTSYNAYREAWVRGLGGPSPTAQQLDSRLHADRLLPGTHTRRLSSLPWRSLPDGAFVLDGDAPELVLRDRLVTWTREGYAGSRSRPVRGDVRVITPASTVAVLRSGYPVQIDRSASE